jgi:DNA-binding response OmpR family regulator
MVVQIKEGAHALPAGDSKLVQMLDLVMVIHLNGAIDMPQKSVVVDRLVGEIKKQFSGLPNATRSLVLDDLVLDQDRHEVSRASKRLTLTPMEYSLLEYLLLRPDRVIREHTLLSEVFHSNGKVNPQNTLWVHMHRLRKKVDRGHPTRLLYTIRGVGYVLRTPASSPQQ